MNVLKRIDDYVANRLSPQELEVFEIELLTNSELQDQLSDHLALKHALTAITSKEASVPAELLVNKPPVFYVETMRGESPKLEIPCKPVLLAVDVGPGEHSSFKCEIHGNSKQFLSETTEADTEGYVNVLVPELAPGAYELSVETANLSRTITLSAVGT